MNFQIKNEISRNKLILVLIDYKKFVVRAAEENVEKIVAQNPGGWGESTNEAREKSPFR